jgi:hypothetical protein
MCVPVTFRHKRAPQRRDVELLHFHQGCENAIAFCRLLAVHHFRENGRNDLPGQTIFVLQPAALLACLVGGELCPEIVNLFLSVAIHD